MNANFTNALTVLMLLMAVGCGNGGHDFIVSTDLDPGKMMEAEEQHRELLLHDVGGVIGQVQLIKFTGDGRTELLVASNRSEYQHESWISQQARLRADGAILISDPKIAHEIICTSTKQTTNRRKDQRLSATKLSATKLFGAFGPR